jgi:hypothetical protein
MKILKIITITAITVSFLALVGCEEPKGYLELKEPMKEPSEIHQGKAWNVSDGFPGAKEGDN